MLHLGLAPESCQSCPFGQAGSAGLCHDGAGERAVPVLPKQEPPREGLLKECLGRVGSFPSPVVPYAPACTVSGLSSPGITSTMKDFALAHRAGPASMATL